jgi:hypothetical protein
MTDDEKLEKTKQELIELVGPEGAEIIIKAQEMLPEVMMAIGERFPPQGQTSSYASALFVAIGGAFFSLTAAMKKRPEPNMTRKAETIEGLAKMIGESAAEFFARNSENAINQFKGGQA